MKNETLHIATFILAFIISAMIFFLFALTNNNLNAEIEIIKRDIKTIQLYHEAEEWNDILIKKSYLTP